MPIKTPTAGPNDGSIYVTPAGLRIVLNRWRNVAAAIVMLPLPLICVALLLTYKQWEPSNWGIESYAASGTIAFLGFGFFASFSGVCVTIQALGKWTTPWQIDLLPDGALLTYFNRQEHWPWADIGGFRGRRHQITYEETTATLMLPIGPATFTFSEVERKTIRWRDFQLLARRNDRVLATFLPSYHFDRWYRQKCVADSLDPDGGAITWQNASVIAVSLAKSYVNDELLEAGVPLLEQLPDLAELDLSNTKVSDEGLQKLAVLTNLKTVRTAGSHVTPAGEAGLMAALAKRQQRGQFAFLEECDSQ